MEYEHGICNSSVIDAEHHTGAGVSGWPGTAPASITAESSSVIRRGHIRQSVARWCYPKLSVDELSEYGAQIGLKAVDLLNPEEYEIPRRYGLVCAMAYADAGTIPDGLNRIENHANIETALRKNIPLAAKAGVPNVIVFSGNRRGMSDEEGARNTILGLNRVNKIAEDEGVTICLELLNSKVDASRLHVRDHTTWGVRRSGSGQIPQEWRSCSTTSTTCKSWKAISFPLSRRTFIGLDIFIPAAFQDDMSWTNQQEVQWDGGDARDCCVRFSRASSPMSSFLLAIRRHRCCRL